MSMTLVARPQTPVARSVRQAGAIHNGDWIRLGSDWSCLDDFMARSLPDRPPLSGLSTLPESDVDIYGPPVLLPAQDVGTYMDAIRSSHDQLYDVNTDFDWDALLSLLEYCERHQVGTVFRLV